MLPCVTLFILANVSLPVPESVTDLPTTQEEQLSISQEKQSVSPIVSFLFGVSEEDKDVMYEIVSTLGKHNVLSLGLKKSHLKALGKKLKGVQPLQFLAYIFSDEELKQHMKTIQKSSFKWSGFLEGIKPALNRAFGSKEFQEQLKSFATLMNMDYEALKEKGDKKDWDGFVKELIEAKS